jgi:hypothetical protein
MKLSPNQTLIINYLADGAWHCMAAADFYMKDDRTRISELRRLGYAFEEKVCDGRCGKKHNARLYMRKLTTRGGVEVAHEPHKLVYVGSNPTPATKCCYSFKVFQSHDPQCSSLKVKTGQQELI